MALQFDEQSTKIAIFGQSFMHTSHLIATINNVTMNRRILDLAIPNIISNITVPLLGMVDMALMGHLENKAYIGATPC